MKSILKTIILVFIANFAISQTTGYLRPYNGCMGKNAPVEAPNPDYGCTTWYDTLNNAFWVFEDGAWVQTAYHFEEKYSINDYIEYLDNPIEEPTLDYKVFANSQFSFINDGNTPLVAGDVLGFSGVEINGVYNEFSTPITFIWDGFNLDNSSDINLILENLTNELIINFQQVKTLIHADVYNSVGNSSNGTSNKPGFAYGGVTIITDLTVETLKILPYYNGNNSCTQWNLKCGTTFTFSEYSYYSNQVVGYYNSLPYQESNIFYDVSAPDVDEVKLWMQNNIPSINQKNGTIITYTMPNNIYLGYPDFTWVVNQNGEITEIKNKEYINNVLFVDKNGNDAIGQRGSSYHPFRTITEAQKHANNGDIIYVRSGYVYTIGLEGSGAEYIDTLGGKYGGLSQNLEKITYYFEEGSEIRELSNSTAICLISTSDKDKYLENPTGDAWTNLCFDNMDFKLLGHVKIYLNSANLIISAYPSAKIEIEADYIQLGSKNGASGWNTAVYVAYFEKFILKVKEWNTNNKKLVFNGHNTKSYLDDRHKIFIMDIDNYKSIKSDEDLSFGNMLNCDYNIHIKNYYAEAQYYTPVLFHGENQRIDLKIDNMVYKNHSTASGQRQIFEIYGKSRDNSSMNIDIDNLKTECSLGGIDATINTNSSVNININNLNFSSIKGPFIKLGKWRNSKIDNITLQLKNVLFDGDYSLFLVNESFASNDVDEHIKLRIVNSFIKASESSVNQSIFKIDPTYNGQRFAIFDNCYFINNGINDIVDASEHNFTSYFINCKSNTSTIDLNHTEYFPILRDSIYKFQN